MVSRMIVTRIKSWRAKLWRRHSETLAAAASSANRGLSKMHNLPRPMARPWKGQRVDGRIVKSVGEFQNKSSSRVKKWKGGHGNVSAGRWPETEVNRREGTVPRSSNCHRSHILTTDTVRTPHPPIQQHSVSGNGSYLQWRHPHNASGLVCEFKLCSHANELREIDIWSLICWEYSTVWTELTRLC